MTAEFRTSYKDIFSRDLRHIYSGFPSDIEYRAPTPDHDGLSLFDRIHEAKTRTRTPREPLRCYEFLPRYGAVMPSAPAFRRISRKQLQNLINRLSADHRKNTPEPRNSRNNNFTDKPKQNNRMKSRSATIPKTKSLNIAMKSNMPLRHHGADSNKITTQRMEP